MGTIGGVIGLGSGAGMARAAEAMLRALGGGEVALRFKGAPVADGAAANPRLGLANNVSGDVALSPVVIRNGGGGTFEFLVSSRSVQEQFEARQMATAKALFDAAVGFVKDDKVLTIVSISVEMIGGAAYLYRVTAQE